MENYTEVDMLNTKESDNVETVEAKVVDYNTLTKADLIKVIESKDTAINNYVAKADRDSEIHNHEIENLNKYYSSKLKEQANLIQYYERKLKVLKDIITIETGGEK